MTELSFDPSLTCTGWSVFAGGRLLGYGRIIPSKSDTLARRLMKIDCAIQAILFEWKPDTVLIESSSGHVSGRHQKEGGAHGKGLARYGMAVGVVIVRCCLDRGEDGVVVIDENTWTRRVPKSVRQIGIQQTYPDYRIGDDPGGDVSDSIGLWEWWATEQRILALGNT